MHFEKDSSPSARAEHMPDGGACVFLHERRGRMPHRKQDVAQREPCAPVPGQPTGGTGFAFGSGLQRADDVGAVARGGNADEHYVAGTPERLHRLQKTRCNQTLPMDVSTGRIGRQRDGRSGGRSIRNRLTNLRPSAGHPPRLAVARQHLASARHGDGHAPGAVFGHLAPAVGKNRGAVSRRLPHVGNHLQGFGP